MTREGSIQCPQCGQVCIDEGHDTIGCPNCQATFHRAEEPSAAIRLKKPGMALILTACLGIFGNCVLGFASMAIPKAPIPDQAPEGVDEATWQSYRNGKEMAPLIDFCMATFPVLFVYPVVLIAGMQMRARRAYYLCLIGAVFAMMPCSPAFLMGLPCGIWALITLLNRNVRDTFRTPPSQAPLPSP